MWKCFLLCLYLTPSYYAHSVARLDILSPFADFLNASQKSYEYIKPKKHSKELLVYAFTHAVEKNYFVYGHRAVVKDPINMLTVALPKDGCVGSNLKTAVEISKLHECEIALNAGYLYKNTGKCYGNIVNNRIHVLSSESKMSAFGLKRDGSIVIGHHLEDEVYNPITQLVSGFGWLIRDRNINVKQSYEAESCGLMGMNDLFYKRSARTMLGFDINGWVHLVQVDGRTGDTGLTLPEAAAYLKSLGLVNAINLNGGGSSVFIVNNTLVSYPSNTCSDDAGNEILCEQNTSSIICIRRDKKLISKVALLDCCRKSSKAVIALGIVAGILLVIAVLSLRSCLQYRWRYSNLTQPVFNEEHLQDYIEKFAGKSNGDAVELK